MSDAVPGTPVGAPLMDRLYRHQRHIYDLTRKHYLLGRDQLITGLQPPPGSRVLEIGCGTARNLVLAARRYPDVEFYGIDISFEMLETARKAVVREGLTAHIQLAQADAVRFDPALLFGVPSFARIFVSYSLSMIPAWPAVLATAVQWLAPGGEPAYRIYISGDTLVFDELKEIPRRYPGLDLALLHLGGTRIFGVLVTMAEACGFTTAYCRSFADRGDLYAIFRKPAK